MGPGRKSSRSWALIGWMLGQPRRFSVELCQSSTPVDFGGSDLFFRAGALPNSTFLCVLEGVGS